MTEKKETIIVDYGSQGERKIEVNFPSNSHTKKVSKVIKSPVVQRKKTIGKKLFEGFLGDTTSSISSYIIEDVLIPAIKGTISDMVHAGTDIIQGSVEVLLFGERRGTRNKRDQNKSFVSYSSFSSGNSRLEKREIPLKSRTLHNFDDIVLRSRPEAEEVLSNMVDLIIDYGQVTVADLYDLVEISANHADVKYGWLDLSSASVSRARDGYLLNLPKPKLLD